MHKKQPLIKKNDKVIVRTGKDKGKIGTVLNVNSERGRLIIEKVNVVKRHTKPSGVKSQGGIIQKEAPVDISNVMLVCSKCTEPSRVGSRTLEDGSRARVCKKCGDLIDA